jgi:hypothetical protein
MLSRIGQVPKFGSCYACSNGVLLPSTCWFVCWHFVPSRRLAWYLRYDISKRIRHAYATTSQMCQVLKFECCSGCLNGVLLLSTCWFVCWHIVPSRRLAWYLRYDISKRIRHAYDTTSQMCQVLKFECCSGCFNGVLLPSPCRFVCWHFVPSRS